MTDGRRQRRKVQMDEKAWQSYRISQPLDPSFLQHVAASGMLLGQSGTASDSKEARWLLARTRAL
eukprot:9307885-Alexandrium_andersonii.AAC.1